MSQSKTLVPVKGHPGIYKRGGSYVVRYRDPQGASRKRHAKTLAQARKIKAEVTADISRGEYRTNSKVTFGEYAASWRATFAGRSSNGIRPETLKQYRADLDRYVIPAFGRRRLAEIEHRHIKEFLMKQAARGISYSRVRNIYAPLRALLKTAVEEGLIRYDPTAGVRITRVQVGYSEDESTEPVKAYSDDELRRLLEAVSPDWVFFVRLLAETGLRVSEAIALRWMDIDLGARRVKVTRRLYKGLFGPPKSRYGRRAVPISQDVAQELWRRRGEAGAAAADEAPVFPNTRGGYLDYNNVYSRVLAPAQKRVGIDTGTHVLRHTCATNLFKAGFNAKQVQIWMGHHSPAFTLATYVHLLPDELPEAPFTPFAGTTPSKISCGTALLPLIVSS
jgi:integrase